MQETTISHQMILFLAFWYYFVPFSKVEQYEYHCDNRNDLISYIVVKWLWCCFSFSFFDMDSIHIFVATLQGTSGHISGNPENPEDHWLIARWCRYTSEDWHGTWEYTPGISENHLPNHGCSSFILPFSPETNSKLVHSLGHPTVGRWIGPFW